jgi:hypothetical protein
MFASIRWFAVVIIAMLVTPQDVRAQSIAEIAKNWGLVGAWKKNCSEPASRTNDELAYLIRGGKLFFDREFGDTRDSSSVVFATIRPNGEIEFVVKFDSISQTRQIVEIKGSDGRKRTISNKNVDTDQYTVVDGKFTANNGETPWLTRCR